MTFLESEWVDSDEFWDDELTLFSPELISRMKELGDIATGLHTWLYGIGRNWNGRGDLVC